MALITLPLYTAAFIFFTISVLGQDLRCYRCESATTKACEDPIDVSVVSVMDCNSATYHPPLREEDTRSLTEQVLDRSVDGQFQGGQVIEEVFDRNVAQRSQTTYRHVCLKVVLTSGELKATTRSCAKLPADVKDPCDFVQQEIGPKVTVQSCYSCDREKCNSASLFAVSGIAIISSMFVVIFRLIF